ncbi:di-heme oxidoredictase family protein [Microbulbifer agarilyticus]|uniref:di-heme oxidoredictase family protein n=1 Tax=Microbulbifer agarilyticus TaxID=260552 RepID=UPI00296F5BDB|nr:di-heme oxidoredictase family protein [Microbulbifer agarilyticus]
MIRSPLWSTVASLLICSAVAGQAHAQSLIHVEAEDYDAYYDSDPGDNGGAGNGDDVDIETTTDDGGGRNIAWTESGEWLEYTLRPKPGFYSVFARVASNTGGGAFSLSLDGVSIGSDTVPSTGGWQSFETRYVGSIDLSSRGRKTFRMDVDAGNFNVNWFELVPDTDSDGDGIPDLVDQCAATPAGTTVDAVGCPVTTGGGDSDNDGVSDALDQCPGTPAGTAVDANGCPVSSGEYGLTETGVDSVELFVNSSSWADAHYSVNGGGQQNVRMTQANNRNTYIVTGLANGDEINYYFTYWDDALPGAKSTSPVTHVFGGGDPSADSDGDGVVNGQDQCPATPPGATVDANGCEVIVDSDGDGVADGSDLCPGTPAGTQVDANGCELAAGDADGDGVEDAQDLCPGTAAGTPVDATGCPLPTGQVEVSFANTMLVGGADSAQPGYTLYVFDSDLNVPGTSQCNDGCATNWPPVLVTDGFATGVVNLSTIQRADGSYQAAYEGRPLYFYAGDNAAGDTNGDGAGGVWWTVPYGVLGAVTPLFDNAAVLEPDTQYETATALVTRFSDRPRTRHAREDEFQSYDHFIKFYFEHRSSSIEIIDEVAKGGDTVTMNVRTVFPLDPNQAENRWWYTGFTTVASYASNVMMDYLGTDGEFYYYRKTSNFNNRLGREIQVGDRMEFEISQFSDPSIPRGQTNYYGTTFLYVVGEGIVPWFAEAPGVSQFREDSAKIPEEYWLGGKTSMHYQYTNEPNDHFMQMATNLGYDNAQKFLEGRRVHHSSFIDGMHDEDPENGVLESNVGLTGTRYINERCSDCHERNGGAPVATDGELLDRWVFKIGDATGAPTADRGGVLQPNGSGGEGDVSIASWIETPEGLRTPNYQFTGGTPETFSARIAPRLVGLGLLEAIPEASILALEDANDADGDGISGRANRVLDPENPSLTRVGRFGWKATAASVRHQAAAALNTDMGVRTSVMPDPDCGSAQANCGQNSPLMPEENLDKLVTYLSTLGVRPQRVWKAGVEDTTVLQGRDVFRSIGCTGCHTESFQTSEFHPLAEVRNQTIHPYSDMLLHDMGPGLADSLGDGQASGSEWRTTPLWGLGLAACVTGGVTNPTGAEGDEICMPHHAYLHDGRARTVDEAIRWHGGESQDSNDAYQGLSDNDRQALLHFLNSL